MRDEYWKKAKEQILNVLSEGLECSKHRVEEIFKNFDTLNDMHNAKGREEICLEALKKADKKDKEIKQIQFFHEYNICPSCSSEDFKKVSNEHGTNPHMNIRVKCQDCGWENERAERT